MGLFDGAGLGGIIGGALGGFGGALGGIFGANAGSSHGGAAPNPGPPPGAQGPNLTQADITNQFQTVLGRAPTQSELTSYLQYANNGSINLAPTDVARILQSTPEFQQNQLMQYGNIFQNTLGGSDQRILGLAQASVGQQIASTGRSLGSSGYVDAFAQAAQNLATSRQQQLAGFYGQGFGNIASNSAAQGNQALNYAQSQQQNTLDFQRSNYQYALGATNYYNALNTQQSNARQQALFSSLGGGIGMLGGAAAGAGTPIGALGGALIGGSFGSGIGGASAPYQSFSPYTPQSSPYNSYYSNQFGGR